MMSDMTCPNDEPSAEALEAFPDGRELFQTDLGKAFVGFESALGTAWCTDQRESATMASMKRDWGRADEARANLKREIRLALDRFRAAGVREAYAHSLQLADDMTNQRALLLDLMKLAGVEKFKRSAKCLVCGKRPRADDGGMLCQPCRDDVDAHPNMARWIAEGP